MATETLYIPHSHIGVLTAVQQLLDMMDDNDNFCVICRDKFEVGDALAIFGCCSLYYHLQCASTWLNTPACGETDLSPSYVTCMPCISRWDGAIFNAYFPPQELKEQMESIAISKRVVKVPAGVPPANASLVDAAKHYGRVGLYVILCERAGEEQGPPREEELPDLMRTVMERVLQWSFDEHTEHRPD